MTEYRGMIAEPGWRGRFAALLRRYGYPVALLLFMAYICVGICPLYCYEGDSALAIRHCFSNYASGPTLHPTGYEYAMQPAIYFIVPALKSLFTFLTVEQIYCLVTGIAALAFIPLTVDFIRRLTSLPRLLILFSLFLIPETMAIAMYPNTAIPAFLPAVAGLDALLRRRDAVGVILLLLAPFFRVDVLMIYPVVFFIFLRRNDTLRQSLGESAILATAVAAVILTLFPFLGADLTETLSSYDNYNNVVPMTVRLMAILSFYTLLNILLFPIGIAVMWRRRLFNLLFIAIVPIAINLIVYGRMGCAAKHYLYSLPFLAIVTSEAMAGIIRVSRAHRAVEICFCTILFLFLFTGISLRIPSKPWRDYFYDESEEALTVFTDRKTPYHLKYGIGPGLVLVTFDERMLASGNAFYPLYVHRFKERESRERDRLIEMLEKTGGSLWSNSYSTKNLLIPKMLEGGYGIRYREGKVLLCREGSKEIEVLCTDSGDGDHNDERDSYDKDMGVARQMPQPVYIYTPYEVHRYIFDSYVREGKMKRIPSSRMIYTVTGSSHAKSNDKYGFQ